MHVPHLAALGPVAVAELVLRYVSVGDEIAQHELTIPIVANVVSADEAASAVPDAGVREEVMVLRATNARDEVIKLADEGSFDAAQTLLAQVAHDLRASGLHALVDEAAELEAAVDTVTLVSYDGSSRKNLHYDSWNRRHRNRTWTLGLRGGSRGVPAREPRELEGDGFGLGAPSCGHRGDHGSRARLASE